MMRYMYQTDSMASGLWDSVSHRGRQGGRGECHLPKEVPLVVEGHDARW